MLQIIYNVGLKENTKYNSYDLKFINLLFSVSYIFANFSTL